jgi:hypothetical protein
MATVSVVLLLAAAAILCGVVVVAFGRGGELAKFAADVAPVSVEFTTADIAQIRPPPALFGYNPQVTDDVLSAMARTVIDRDIEIAMLRQQLADLQRSAEPPDPGEAGP